MMNETTEHKTLKPKKLL